MVAGEIKCDKCQYSGDYLFKIKDHRKEKHRLWECLRCGETFINQQSFDKHGRGSRISGRKWCHDCDSHPFVKQSKIAYYTM